MKVFQYEDYRSYLRDHVEAQGSGAKKGISIAMGISPSLMSQVLSGDRDLSQDQAYKFSEIANFNPSEKLYWLTLLDSQRASSLELKEFYKKRLENFREEAQQNDRVRMGIDQTPWSSDFISVFYSSWHFVVIYCALGMQERWSTEELAHRFDLPSSRIEQVMEFLVDHGIVQRLGNELYQLVRTDYVYLVSTESPVQQAASVHNAKNFRRKAMEVFEQHQMTKNREPIFRSTVALISKSDYKVLEQAVKDLFESFNNKIADANFEEIVCLNVDFFKI